MQRLVQLSALPTFTGVITVHRQFDWLLTIGRINLDVQTVAQLSGAPDGANVSLFLVHDGISMVVEHACFLEPAEMRLSMQTNDPNSQLVLHIDNLEIAERGKGVATMIVDRMARAALAYQVSSFCLLAVSDKGEACDAVKNGTYAWVKMGFDGRIDLYPYDYTLATPVLATEFMTERIRTVAQVMAHPDGPAFWAGNDREVHMEFDLQLMSRSWTVLQQRLATKGLV